MCLGGLGVSLAFWVRGAPGSRTGVHTSSINVNAHACISLYVREGPTREGERERRFRFACEVDNGVPLSPRGALRVRQWAADQWHQNEVINFSPCSGVEVGLLLLLLRAPVSPLFPG